MTTTLLPTPQPYRQKSTLYLVVVTTRLITGLLSLHWQKAGTGQVLALTVAFALALSGAWCVNLLCRRAQKPLFEAIDALCGRWAGVLVALVSVLFLIHSAQNLLYILSSIITVQTLPVSAKTAVVVTAAATAALAAGCGMEALGRFARLFGKLLFLVLIFSLLLPIENYRPAYLFPLFGNGPRALFSLGVSASADFFGVMLFGLLYDPALEPGSFTRTLYRLPLIAYALCLLFFLCTALLFPYSVTNTVPLYNLLSVISAGHHVQTLAALFSFLWSGAFLVTSGAQLLFCVKSVEAVAPALRRRRKWVIALLAALVAALAALVGANARQNLFTAQLYGWSALYLPIWLCGLIAFFKGNRAQKGTERKPG